MTERSSVVAEGSGNGVGQPLPRPEVGGAANLPEPQKPADLADAMWDLYRKRDRFDQVFGA